MCRFHQWSVVTKCGGCALTENDIVTFYHFFFLDKFQPSGPLAPTFDWQNTCILRYLPQLFNSEAYSAAILTMATVLPLLLRSQCGDDWGQKVSSGPHFLTAMSASGYPQKQIHFERNVMLPELCITKKHLDWTDLLQKYFSCHSSHCSDTVTFVIFKPT